MLVETGSSGGVGKGRGDRGLALSSSFLTVGDPASGGIDPFERAAVGGVSGFVQREAALKGIWNLQLRSVRGL